MVSGYKMQKHSKLAKAIYHVAPDVFERSHKIGWQSKQLANVHDAKGHFWR